MTELIELQNIIDNFILPSIISPLDIEELTESSAIIIHDYVAADPMMYIYPHFHETLHEEVLKLMRIQLEHILHDDEEVEEVICDAVDNAISIFCTSIAPKRSYGDTFIRKPCNHEKMEKKIEYLENVPQPEQRTPEWYAFRHKCLTASSIWKAFGTPGAVNQLIYDKCAPIDTSKYSRVATGSPMHWGHKYEPVSIMWYESTYDTIVSDFGCIPHPNINHIAASPDGINTSVTSERHGRMLEVKNIVNREINGIPKLEYWVQMQIQMEVCSLNECDFLETRFTEYEDVEKFEEDGDFTTADDGNIKGIMIYFIKGGQPHYEYGPIGISKDAFDIWEQEIMKKNEDITWMQNIYWKLCEISCVLVLRNKLWFESAVPILENIWSTIVEERVSGYSHRAPKKKNSIKKFEIIKVIPTKCYIDVSSLLEDGNSEEIVASVPKPNSPELNMVISIDTECLNSQSQTDDS